jgi:hypothetical protein
MSESKGEKAAKALDPGRSSLVSRHSILAKSFFGTTDYPDLHGWAEKRRAILGQAKLALCFQIPSQASLHEILNPHRSFCCAKIALRLHLAQRSLGKKHRVALGFQAGICCEKASASPLASVFSTTNPAFA